MAIKKYGFVDSGRLFSSGGTPTPDSKRNSQGGATGT